MATSGFFVFFTYSLIQKHITDSNKSYILNRVNIYLQDVPVISVRLVVILVSFLVISVIRDTALVVLDGSGRARDATGSHRFSRLPVHEDLYL